MLFRSESVSPEMTKSDMVKMLKMQQTMLEKLTTATAAESETVPVSANTRSSEKAKKRQKK